MATQVSKSFPPAFPNELLGHIYSFLPNETVVKTAEVSKAWRDELADLRKDVVDQWSEKKYVKIFWDCGFRISQFALLQLPKKIIINSLSTSLQPCDLSDPIMRYRNAIVMKIEGISDESIFHSRPGPFSGIIYNKILIRELTSVLAILKVGNQWKASWSSDAAKGVYKAVHSESHKGEENSPCSACPFPEGGISDEILKGILTGTDPYFQLMKKNPQKLPEESKV